MLVELFRLPAEAFIEVVEERSANTSASEECQDIPFRAAKQGNYVDEELKEIRRVMVHNISAAEPLIAIFMRVHKRRVLS
jgi:hypothetical protein